MSEPTTRTLDANTRGSRRDEDLGRSVFAFSLASAAAAAAAARFAARSDLLARDEDRLFSARSSRLTPRSHGFSVRRPVFSERKASRSSSRPCPWLGASRAAKSSVFSAAALAFPNARSGAACSPVAAALKTRAVTASDSASRRIP